jgi:hypothetical protein
MWDTCTRAASSSAVGMLALTHGDDRCFEFRLVLKVILNVFQSLYPRRVSARGVGSAIARGAVFFERGVVPAGREVAVGVTSKRSDLWAVEMSGGGRRRIRSRHWAM